MDRLNGSLNDSMDSDASSLWLLFNRCMAASSHEDSEVAESCRNFFDNYFENQGMHFKVGMLAALALLFLVGVAGNALVILSIVIFPSMRSRTNIFLLNLAVSDLLVFFMCLPFTAYRVLRTRWLFGVLICKLSPFLQGVSISVSIGSLASMSIKRYLVIRYPMTAKERMSNRAMALWIASIWLLSVLLSSPITVAHKLTGNDFFWNSSSQLCVEEWSTAGRKTAYTMFVFIALYLAPLIAMAVFYSMLGKALISTVKFTRQVTNETHQSSLRAVGRGRVKVSKMMIALLLAFAVCWLPHHVITIFMDFRQRGGSGGGSGGGGVSGGGNFTSLTEVKTASSPLGGASMDLQAGNVNVVMKTALPIALLLGYANSAINPLCLLMISSKFKKYFKLILTCHCGEDSRAMRARSEQLQMYSLCSRQHQQQLHHQQQPQHPNAAAASKTPPQGQPPPPPEDSEQVAAAVPLVQNHHSD